MELKRAVKILEQTRKNYDLIAKEWNITRPWPRVAQINAVKDVRKGEKILDIGCGNGVLYDALSKKSIDYTGVDVSSKLLKLAKARMPAKAKLMKGDILDLPFKDGLFDWVFAFAVLHHIPSEKLQNQAMREMYRVLKPNGKVMVSVWNLYSDYAKKRFKIAEQLKNRPTGWNKNDLTIPWKATAPHVVNRYIYRFTQKNLSALLRRQNFKKIKTSLQSQSGQATRDIKNGQIIILRAQK